MSERHYRNRIVHLIAKLNELQEAYIDNARYWVNDYGVSLDGTIVYEGIGDPLGRRLVPVHNLVGLVDEHDGGMIAYGKPEVMESLADRLNKLHIIEELMHS